MDIKMFSFKLMPESSLQDLPNSKILPMYPGTAAK